MRRRSRRIFRIRTVIIALTGSALAGPGMAAEPSTTDREFIELQTSLNAIMVAVVDWSAHEVWEASYADDMTDRNWLTLKQYATELLASGTLVSLGGTGRVDRSWVTSDDWQDWTSAMIEESKEIVRAVDEKNQDRMRAAGERLVEVCEGCHDAFKPALPTEGIMHVPHHEYADPLIED